MQEQKTIPVGGQLVNSRTGCIHYHSPLDVIAIKFKCCDRYYACYYCHEESVDHPAQRWTRHDLAKPAVLCGVCQHELTVSAYFNSHYHCPCCGAAFNPKCANHNHLYFDLE